MVLRDRRTPLGLTLALVMCVLAGVFASPADAVRYDPTDTYTAHWTRAQALNITLTPTNTKPHLPNAIKDIPLTNRNLWIWDTWPLTNFRGEPVTYQGWHVIFALTAPRSVGYHQRAGFSRIGYFFSRDAKSWQYGGHLFPDGAAPNPWEWAGSTVLAGGNRVEAYYTTVNPSSRLARATGRILADEDGIFFRGFRAASHTVIVERGETPGTEYYQTDEENPTPRSAIRGPSVTRPMASTTWCSRATTRVGSAATPADRVSSDRFRRATCCRPRPTACPATSGWPSPRTQAARAGGRWPRSCPRCV